MTTVWGVHVHQICDVHCHGYVTMLEIEMQSPSNVYVYISCQQYNVRCLVCLQLISLCLTVSSFTMPVKVTKDEFGVTSDGKHISRSQHLFTCQNVREVLHAKCYCSAVVYMVSRHFGPRTLRHQDTSAPVLKCLETLRHRVMQPTRKTSSNVRPVIKK